MRGYLTREEERTVERVIKRIKGLLKGNLIVLELFGSKIRGDSLPDSDIDMLVVVKNKDAALRDSLYDILFDIDPYYKFKISLIIYSEFEYQENIRLKSPFIENLKKEGVAL